MKRFKCKFVNRFAYVGGPKGKRNLMMLPFAATEQEALESIDRRNKICKDEPPAILIDLNDCIFQTYKVQK